MILKSIKAANAKKPEWYVIHAYSGHENKVATALKKRAASLRMDDRILEVFVPTQEKIEIREGKRKNTQERIFPGYILVKMTMDDETLDRFRFRAAQKFLQNAA